MRGAVRIGLGPVLLMQGKRVRRQILRMPEPEGARRGQTGSGPGLSLLILGDSAAAGVGAPTQAEALSGRLVAHLAAARTVHWRLLAKTGWTTQDALDALPGLEGAPLDAAVISLGVNDITTETGLRGWLTLYRALLARLRTDHGVRAFVLSGMPPMGRFPALPQPLRWYMGLQARAHDRALARLAAGRADAIHLPLALEQFRPEDGAEDGFHPGPPIYAEWAARAATTLDGLLARPVAPAG